jgi:hypothetical protein
MLSGEEGCGAFLGEYGTKGNWLLAGMQNSARKMYCYLYFKMKFEEHYMVTLCPCIVIPVIQISDVKLEGCILGAIK